MTFRVEGECLCGTLRYEVNAPFTSMIHCHCSMCRKHHGAPFATFAAAPANAFRWIAGESAVRKYQSSAQGFRCSCKTCGSVAPFTYGELAFCPAGNLQGDPGIRPQMHLFVDSKPAWCAITDDLPQHEGYPPEWGGGLGVSRPPIQAREGAISGSCLCGDVAYEFDQPVRMMLCHCSRCRRGRSAAHTTNAFCKIDDFRWTRGEQQVRDYRVPEARYFGIAHCDRCGGAVPRISTERGIVVIPVGALDSNPGIEPTAHIFVGSKAPWFEITDALPQFQELPSQK